MTSKQPRTSTSSRSNRDDVLQFLDSLDTYSGQPAPTAPGGGPATSSSGPTLPRSTSSHSALSQSQSASSGNAPKTAQEAQSVLDFLDEITASKTSSPPPHASAGAPPRASIERRTPVSGMRTATSRSNLSQIASSPSPQGAAAGTTGAASAAARRSTESVRSQRSAAGGGAERASPAALNRTLPSNVGSSQPPTQGASSMAATQPAASTSSAQPAAPAATGGAAAAGGGGGWGWSSVWSTASTAINQASQLAQQARTVAEEQVKANAGGIGEGLMKAWNHEDGGAHGERGPGGEGSASGGMKKWTEGVQGLVKNANLEGLGKELKSTTLKSLTDLLNAVAPPIAEHEVIQVSLSHDMKGYDGVETLVYRGLSKIMEQIEGGTLMVTRAADPQGIDGDRPSAENAGDEEERNLNSIEGLEAGWELAQSTLDRLIASTYKPPEDVKQSPSSVTLPVTNCPVYLRLQPVIAPLPSMPTALTTSRQTTTTPVGQQLYFLLVLIDPTHSLSHYTVSQPIPASWLEIPFEENEWVEEFMVDTIRGATEVVGQEYIAGRMRAQGDAIELAKDEARKTLEQTKLAVEGGNEDETEVSAISQEARVGIV